MDTMRTLAVAFIGAISLSGGQTIVDDDFDDGVVTGWESIGNSLGATHEITEEGGELTSVVVGTEANLNTNRGIISTTPFNPSEASGGFTMTFVVSGQGELAPGANGMFLGLTSSNTTFFRLDGVPNFGLVFFGHPVRTQSNGGVSLVTNDIGVDGPLGSGGVLLDVNPDAIELASFQDGFTATISADETGWSYSVSDLNDLVGTPATFANGGTWAEAGTDFASVFGGVADWYLLASNQGDPSLNTHTVVYDRITLERVGSGGGGFEITDLTIDPHPVNPTNTVTWRSRPNRDYALFYSTDGELWTEINDSIPSDGDSTRFPHELLPDFGDLVGAPALFYRVQGAE